MLEMSAEAAKKSLLPWVIHLLYNFSEYLSARAKTVLPPTKKYQRNFSGSFLILGYTRAMLFEAFVHSRSKTIHSVPVAWHQMKMSIQLQKYIRFISCKKVLPKCSSGYFPWGWFRCSAARPKNAVPPCDSPRDFGLDFESASIFSYKIYLSMNSGAFHMLGAEKCCRKRHIFYSIVQYRMLHHTLHVGSHEFWWHADNYGFLSSWIGA